MVVLTYRTGNCIQEIVIFNQTVQIKMKATRKKKNQRLKNVLDYEINQRLN